MGWAVPGLVLRRDRATTGVTEPLEDGTTAQTDVKDVRKRDIAVFNLYHLQLILFKNASCTGCPKKNFPLAHFRVFESGRGVFGGEKWF